MSGSYNRDNLPYNLRSRKPKMVPYTQSHGPNASFMVDVVGDNDPGSSLSPNPKIGKEAETFGSGDLSLGNGRSGLRDDEGGGRTNNIGHDGGGDQWIDTKETSFINNNADTRPLLDSDLDSEDTTRVMLKESSETSLQICLQVTLPYIIAGFGMVAAGMVLDIVQVSALFFV